MNRGPRLAPIARDHMMRAETRLRPLEGNNRAPLRLAGEYGANFARREFCGPGTPRATAARRAPLVPVTVKARRGLVEKNKNLPW
jgi:hypothetical protein